MALDCHRVAAATVVFQARIIVKVMKMGLSRSLTVSPSKILLNHKGKTVTLQREAWLSPP